MSNEAQWTVAAPDLVGVGAESIVERAKFLGLTWDLRPGTITKTDVDSMPLVAFDGPADILPVPITATNLTGQALSIGARVMVTVVPPSGNFITGFLTPEQWLPYNTVTTGLTVGSGSVVSRFSQVGTTVNYSFKFILGAGSAISGPRFTLPVQPHARYLQAVDPLGNGTLADAGLNNFFCLVRLVTGSIVEVVGIGTNGIHTAVTSTVPFSWGPGDSISTSGTYEGIQ